MLNPLQIVPDMRSTVLLYILSRLILIYICTCLYIQAYQRYYASCIYAHAPLLFIFNHIIWIILDTFCRNFSFCVNKAVKGPKYPLNTYCKYQFSYVWYFMCTLKGVAKVLTFLPEVWPPSHIFALFFFLTNLGIFHKMVWFHVHLSMSQLSSARLKCINLTST